MTGLVPRLLGAATVGAGVAAAGYVGLVTGRQAPGAGARRGHGLGRPFHPLGGRLGLVAQTVETVRFTRPERVDFRLVRGPVPHVVEAFVLTERAGGTGTRLAYDGEIGADLWGAGQRWSELVARRWEQTVAASLAAVKAEAERRASSAVGRRRSSVDRPSQLQADDQPSQ
jgi:hypothetical protein